MSKAREEDISIAEAALATTWQPGVRIEKFTLVGKIATGGMAEIWLSRQAGPRGFEKLVVIKKILDSYVSDEGFIEMFLDEARTAAQLTHPNVVQIYDLGEFERAYFIAMEFIAGEHLARIAKASARTGKLMPFAHAARIIADAAHGLHYAHTKIGSDGQPLNIVHRDVSPQNVMITYDGVVKVLDFGVAKAANRSTHTEAGKFKGKIAYMAPEVARAEPFDAKADVFALGIMLWEMLGRARLFDFEDPVEGVLEVSKREPAIASVKEKNPEVPHELAAIVARALERDPKVRYQTAKELAVALEDWLRTQPSPPEAAALAAYMNELFAERIAKQNAVIAEIRNSPSGVIQLRANTGEVSLPGSRSGSVIIDRRAISIGALAVGSLAVLGVVLWSGRPTAQGSVAPPPRLLTTLFIDSEPAGAVLTMDGRYVGTAPVTLTDVALGPHKVLATAPGHEPNDVLVKIERLGEKTNIMVSLKPLAAAPIEVADGGDSSANAPARAKGRLTLAATPWAEVYLGGRKLGETPLVGYPLPVGKHSLRLFNPEKKLEKVISVEIKSGQTTSLKQKL